MTQQRLEMGGFCDVALVEKILRRNTLSYPIENTSGGNRARLIVFDISVLGNEALIQPYGRETPNCNLHTPGGKNK